MSQKQKNKGRVLRVKTGYNPNSSSIGSQIPGFLAFATSSGAFSVIALHILNVVRRHIHRKKDSLK